MGSAWTASEVSAAPAQHRWPQTTLATYVQMSALQTLACTAGCARTISEASPAPARGRWPRTTLATCAGTHNCTSNPHHNWTETLSDTIICVYTVMNAIQTLACTAGSARTASAIRSAPALKGSVGRFASLPRACHGLSRSSPAPLLTTVAAPSLRSEPTARVSLATAQPRRSTCQSRSSSVVTSLHGMPSPSALVISTLA